MTLSTFHFARFMTSTQVDDEPFHFTTTPPAALPMTEMSARQIPQVTPPAHMTNEVMLGDDASSNEDVAFRKRRYYHRLVFTIEQHRYDVEEQHRLPLAYRCRPAYAHVCRAHDDIAKTRLIDYSLPDVAIRQCRRHF